MDRGTTTLLILAALCAAAGQLLFNESAHIDDRITEVLEILVESSRDVVGDVAGFHNDPKPNRALTM